MLRYPDNTIIAIRKFRRETGMSYEELGKKFKIPPSTVRNWCYEPGLSRSLSLERKYEIIRSNLRNSEVSICPKIDKLTSKETMFLAAILYGCEGSKYPSSSGIAFCNSNPGLVAMFYTLLSKSFPLDKTKLRFHLQMHSSQNFNDLVAHWRKILNIPDAYFIKPTVTVPRGGKHRENYLGTCTLRYGDYRLQLKLLGIFEKFIHDRA